MVAVKRPFLVIGVDTETGDPFWDHVEAKSEEEAKVIVGQIRVADYQAVAGLDAEELAGVLALLRAATSDSIADGLETVAAGYQKEVEDQVEDLTDDLPPVPLIIN